LAVLLLIAAGWILLGRRLMEGLRQAQVSHQIAPDLEPVDHIDVEPGALRGYNVLIITTDTTRADHIGCYGNRAIETPVIDSLAHDGVLCAQAITTSPATMPAHSSLMTGLYPQHHGVRANGTFRLDDKIITLAERLQAKGYRTGAAISSFVLDSRFGLDQGFHVYNDDLKKGMQFSPHMFRERPAEVTNEPVFKWLRDNGQEPFFLWVHYFDPHAVYMPPEPFRTQYQTNLYDGEIAYADSQIGALLDQLKRLGVRDKTLIVYTADHGEGLGEHGEQTHSLLVYDATLHVPLVISAPAALPQGKVIQRQTCLVDVVPTVLSLLGEEIPDGLDGVDLCAPPPSEPRPILIETLATMTTHGWAPLIGVRRDDYKYIFAPRPELYELKHDPGELTNLHDQQPDVVKQLSAELARWLGQDPYLATRQAVDLAKVDADEETLRRLAALGYVSTRRVGLDDAAQMLDPKDMIVHWETVQQAINMDAAGKTRDAIRGLESCLAEVPGDNFARLILASAYREQGNLDRAMANYELALEHDDGDPAIHLGIAAIHVSRREFDKAQQKIDDALRLQPGNSEAYLVRGRLAQSRSKVAEAIKFYEQAIDMSPGTSGPTGYVNIGFLHMYLGRLDQAREAFQNALDIDALNGQAHDGLANVLRIEGKFDEAMNELRLAVRFDPNQPRALATLGFLVSEQGDHNEALKLCLRAQELAPTDAVVLNNLGLIYRRRGDLESAEKYYKQAIEQDPQLDGAYINLAQLYAQQGKKEESFEQFAKAVQANPSNPNPISLANLGVFHFNRGIISYDDEAVRKSELQLALEFYRRALRGDPDYAMVHHYLADLYSLVDYNRPDLAAFHLRRTLELDPKQPEAAQLRESLEAAEAAAAERTAESSGAASIAPPAATPSTAAGTAPGKSPVGATPRSGGTAQPVSGPTPASLSK
jgi:arylsulfatase A-like enzyme/tetratricopeptide (TPR) repeat protein